MNDKSTKAKVKLESLPDLLTVRKLVISYVFHP